MDYIKKSQLFHKNSRGHTVIIQQYVRRKLVKFSIKGYIIFLIKCVYINFQVMSQTLWNSQITDNKAVFVVMLKHITWR